MIDTSELYLELFKDLLGSPGGLLLLAALAVLLVVVVLYPGVRWYVIAAAMYVSTLPTTGKEGRLTDFQLAFPLEQIRAYSRPLTAIFLMVLVPALVFTSAGWRRRIAIGAAWLFVLFQLGTVLRLVLDSGFLRGGMVGASIVLLVLTILIGASLWVQSFDDLKKLLLAVMVAVTGVVVGTYYQLGVDKSQIMAGNRLIGVTGNPQFLAVLMALTMPIGFYLAFHSGLTKRKRVGILVLLPAMVVLMVWTGSRTGALACAVGMFTMYWRRMGHLALAGAITSLGVLVIASVYDDSLVVADRLMSTEDTRSATWAAMYSRFLSSPLLGGSQGSVVVVENSYLSVLGQFGIIGAIPFFLGMLLLVVALIRCQRGRETLLKDEIWAIDCITGVWAGIAVAAMFEGFLLGVFTFPVLLVYVLFATTCFVTEYLDATAKRSELELARVAYRLE